MPYSRIAHSYAHFTFSLTFLVHIVTFYGKTNLLREKFLKSTMIDHFCENSPHRQEQQPRLCHVRS